MKERVITYERILLKTFGFIIHCVHPHKFVNSFVHSLEGGDELQQLAWNMLNDSLRTTLCVRFKGHVVAAGAIYLAARRLQVPLPSSPAWWEAFKVPTDQMVEVVLALDALYRRPKAHYIEVNPEVLKQQQALSGPAGAKQLTPGPGELGNDSPAVAQDSSVIRGGPDLASQQLGGPPGPGTAAAVVAGSTAAPPGNAAEMLAAAVALAQQRLQGSVALASGINAAQAAAVAAAAQAAQAAAAAAKPDPDTVSTLHQGGDGQANGGGPATSAVEGGAVQSRKRSRSRDRSQDRNRRRSRSSSRSRSRSRDRHRNGSRRDHRSRSRERRDRDRDRERRDHRDHRDRDRDRERERENERERERERRDGGRDRERDRERGRERGRDDRDGADRGDLPAPPPLPPRPDRRR
ncbi:hypothetical protein HYH02_004969 [Chlamydomonas schloesseri]|nr:hypothetical protein HYH02_004969 [Chlamydomonas schloesseri]|eukprot:KAG2450468.1 hypothetical protein HYH02_004969 [Chlamydomonas schloesseri]